MPAVEAIRTRVVSELLEEYPFAASFFQNNDIEVSGRGGMTVGDLLARVRSEADEDTPFDAALNLRQLCEYIDQMLVFLSDDRRKSAPSQFGPARTRTGRARDSMRS